MKVITSLTSVYCLNNNVLSYIFENGLYLICISGCQFIIFVIEGKVSFNNRSLHVIGYTSNPYEKAISVMGKTLSPFAEDN